ncbi:MAG: tRNA glutamyl-Q(34) synthetase GluQRS [Rhodobacterales bacterium]
MIRERFAPSPTGLLHLGHAYSALIAWDAARANGGEFLLRMEDSDKARCKGAFEDAICADLAWLGISWPEPILHQTNRMAAYQSALDNLIALDLCYPCNCSRKDIEAALSAPQEAAPHRHDPDGPIYPKTCSKRSMTSRTEQDAVRLNMAKAVDYLGGPSAVDALTYTEIGLGKAELIQLDADKLINECGDIVLARKDIGTSYHLAVVIDDAFQNITHVTRGIDIAAATPIHRILQALLNLPAPVYRHHRLIRDENGKRLAKRHDAMAIAKYRAQGASPQGIRKMVGL